MATTANPLGVAVGGGAAVDDGLPWSRIKQQRWLEVDQCCEVCGVDLMPQEVIGHHIINRSRGGVNAIGNCEVRCVRCESAMHTLFRYGNPLRNANNQLLVELYLGIHQEWGPNEPIPSSRLCASLLDVCKTRRVSPEARRIDRCELRRELDSCRRRVAELYHRWSLAHNHRRMIAKDLEMLRRRERGRDRRGDQTGARRFRRGRGTLSTKLYALQGV